MTNRIHMTKKTTRPLVSVIMPVYNAREFVAEAIESIISQTLKNWELLIVDDHSTDGSWEIIKEYAKKDPRIQIFRNKQNIGLVLSLNFLIPKTTGRYVARMDADDVSLPDRLKKQVAFLRKHPNVVACGGQAYIIDKNGVAIAEKYFPTDPKTCYHMIANFMVIQPPILMTRGHIFRSLTYDNHLFKNDDISMHFKLLDRGNFSNVNEIIFKYRKRPNSITHKNPKRVYFLALLVRLNAVLKHHFRPSIGHILLALGETGIVALLPNSIIISLFESIRFTHNVFRRFGTTTTPMLHPTIGYTK